MSVDVSAGLVFGWMVKKDKLTERFWEMLDDDFEQLDGKYGESLGEPNGYELVTRVDEYSENSDYHIGIAVRPQKRVYEGERFTGFRQMELPEFYEEIGGLVKAVEPLKELFEDVMGYAPKTEPYFCLEEFWW